jgi:hypothetical protein
VSLDGDNIIGYQVNVLVTLMVPEGKPAIW